MKKRTYILENKPKGAEVTPEMVKLLVPENETGYIPFANIQTSNFTAVNLVAYSTNGTLTVTDPTPETNKGYIVHVVGGTTTIGGVGYTAGALVYRFYDGTVWTSKDYGSGGGGGATDLAYTPSPTNGTVTSSTGTDAIIPLADGTNAGLLSPSEKIAIGLSSVKKQITHGYEYFNDFEGQISTTTNDTHIAFVVTSGGSLSKDPTVNSGLRFNTGVNSNGGVTMFAEANGSTNANFSTITSLYFSQLSNDTDRFAFVFGRTNSILLFFSTGMAFIYDRYNVLGYGISNDNWHCIVRNGGNITQFDSGVAVTTSNSALQKLEIQVLNLAEVKFFINNTQVGSTVTTNISIQNLLNLLAISKNLGTTSVFVSSDYLYYENKLLTPRI
jgi:hypothetical protein